MHVEVMGASKGVEVDHISGDLLDCCKRNLRYATHQQNLFNQKIRSNNTSGYKGVTWNKARGKWQSQIMVNGHNIYLGLFDLVQDAALAYDNAASNYFGKHARLNLAGSSHRTSTGDS